MANGYPIDQRGNTGSVGDDTPTEHAAWTLQLQAAGLPGSPIEKQTAGLTIDHGNDRDYISDKGDEVWNVIEGNGIKNVLIMGAPHMLSMPRPPFLCLHAFCSPRFLRKDFACPLHCS